MQEYSWEISTAYRMQNQNSKGELTDLVSRKSNHRSSPNKCCRDPAVFVLSSASSTERAFLNKSCFQGIISVDGKY